MAQVGDRIHHPQLKLEGTVKSVKADTGALDVLWDDGSRYDVTIPGISQNPIAPLGSRVHHPHLTLEGTVTAFINGQTMVKWDDGSSMALEAPQGEPVGAPAAMPGPRPSGTGRSGRGRR